MGCGGSKPKGNKKQSTGGDGSNQPADKPTVFFVLGRSGAGKGTQLVRLAADHGFVHLSMGDILRAEIESGSKDGEMISNTIKEGGCLDFDFFWPLVDREIQKAGSSKKVLLDGFPRSEENSKSW